MNIFHTHKQQFSTDFIYTDREGKDDTSGRNIKQHFVLMTSLMLVPIKVSWQNIFPITSAITRLVLVLRLIKNTIWRTAHIHLKICPLMLCCAWTF